MAAHAGTIGHSQITIGGGFMDRITKALLDEFSNSFEISDLPESDRFEHFATYLTVRRHYSDTSFLPADLVTGSGNDTGIDAIAIIVNNHLVLDVDTIPELLFLNKYLDVEFVFVQAERSSQFDSGKIGHFGFGVQDFFGQGTLVRNAAVWNAADIMDRCFQNSGRFTKGNPSLHMYYVTTGRWQDDANLIARYRAVEDDLRQTGHFRAVEFHPIGADLIQKLYNQSRNAITREFTFDQRTVIPDIANVREAHLGHMSARSFLEIICDEENELISSLFQENVRDWHGYNQINDEIRETLRSTTQDRFVLMNNGVTIVAKSLHTTGHKFTMSDFHIVNGCQTSNVLYDNRDLVTDAVRIPIRIISTQDESVMEAVITATNRQTEVKEDQFFAMRAFAKRLEAYFQTFDGDRRIYYERRSHQYDAYDIPKTRIITHQNLVRAVGAMFLAEPHRTTRTYRLLREKVGREIFVDTDRLEPYYVAAYTLYKLENMYRSKKIASEYKAARYQILLSARLLMDCGALPWMNSNDMQRRCEAMMKRLWDDADGLLVEAAGFVNRAAQGNLTRDHIRRQPVTNAILEEFGQRPSSAAAVT